MATIEVQVLLKAAVSFTGNRTEGNTGDNDSHGPRPVDPFGGRLADRVRELLTLTAEAAEP